MNLQKKMRFTSLAIFQNTNPRWYVVFIGKLSIDYNKIDYSKILLTLRENLASFLNFNFWKFYGCWHLDFRGWKFEIKNVLAIEKLCRPISIVISKLLSEVVATLLLIMSLIRFWRKDNVRDLASILTLEIMT